MFFFFFFNDTATTEIYTLSLHDALPILKDEGATKVVAYCTHPVLSGGAVERIAGSPLDELVVTDTTSSDRKSTRLNSSHLVISYAVFCLKKKKIHDDDHAMDSAHCLRRR